MQILLGFGLAILIAFVAYRAHSLSPSGAFAATLVGAVVFGMGGWQWAVLLLTFFISSSTLTRAFKKRKAGLDEKYSKGGRRDAAQVFGNGGLATLFAGLHFFQPDAPWVWVAFAASLAAVNADTWATELGVLSPRPPRMMTNPAKEVEKGTSGGVSLVGTLAALGGSGVIGFLAAALGGPAAPYPAAWTMSVAVTLAGLLGSLFDSLLGATVQAIYHCPTCDKETERHPLHTCGAATTLKRGWPWLDNDLVNLGCAIFGVAVALLLVR
jgi:uncharacterized protein (TIGR00297 family)